MTRRFIGAMALAAGLIGAAGCSRSPTYRTYADEAVSASIVKPAAPGPASAALGSAPQVGQPAAGLPMLAYVYRYELEAPAARIAALAARHEAACTSAGPMVCQVTGSNLRQMGKNEVEARLELRASPGWIKAFRSRLAGEMDAAGGKVADSSTETEDLTRQIIDTEARLRASSTLRDRLQTLLATRPGGLADLLKVEQELARVQGEIDATQSALAEMRTRVATSAMTLSYSSQAALAPAAGGPLAEALKAFVPAVASVLAFMLLALAYLLPWALLVAVLVWLLRKPVGRRLARRRRPSAAKDFPAEAGGT